MRQQEVTTKYYQLPEIKEEEPRTIRKVVLLHLNRQEKHYLQLNW